LDYFKSLFIVDAGSFGIRLLIDLADFDVSFVVFGAEFQNFLEQIDTLISLSKSALDLSKYSHCLEAVLVSRIAGDCLKTGLGRLVILIAEEDFPEIKLG